MYQPPPNYPPSYPSTGGWAPPPPPTRSNRAKVALWIVGGISASCVVCIAFAAVFGEPPPATAPPRAAPVAARSPTPLPTVDAAAPTVAAPIMAATDASAASAVVDASAAPVAPAPLLSATQQVLQSVRGHIEVATPPDVLAYNRQLLADRTSMEALPDPADRAERREVRTTLRALDHRLREIRSDVRAAERAAAEQTATERAAAERAEAERVAREQAAAAAEAARPVPAGGMLVQTCPEVSDTFSNATRLTELQREALWHERYEGRRVRWEATVNTVERGMLGGLTVDFKCSRRSLMTDGHAQFDDDQQSALMRFSQGDRIHFEGRLTDWGALLGMSIEDARVIP